MLAGRTGLSPVMVGRSAELSQVAGLLAGGRMHAGDGPAVALVAGEAGIGKTRLVQELIAQTPSGATVLAGQADPGGPSRPLELVLDVLKGVPLDDDEERPRTDAAATRACCDVAGDAERSTDERIDAAVEAMRHLTAGTASLLVFEDIHWADAESLHVFERLTEPTAGRLVAVATYRPDGLSRRHPASGLLPRLERRHRVTRVHLGRLSPADVGAFLTQVYQQVPSLRVVKALHSRTGGNPYFLEELIASAGGIACDELCDVPLPWTVAELVQSQVDGLGSDVRRVVAAAAVLGRRVPFDVLMAVTEVPEGEMIGLLRAALDSGLLIEPEPDDFGFRHELAREAIKAGLLGRERRRLHEKALDVLRSAGSDDHAALARHALGAGRHEDMVRHARQGARDAVKRGASFQALQLAEMGLSEADDDLDLLCFASKAAWLAGLLDDAATYADRWATIARAAGDGEEEADAVKQRMRTAFEAWDLDTMTAQTDVLIDMVDRLPNETARAQAMAVIAQSYMLREHPNEACMWADKALALAEAQDLTDVRVSAMVEKGSMLMHLSDRRHEGEILLEQAIAEAERHGFHVLAGRAVNNLAWWVMPTRSLEEIRELAARVRSHAKAGGWHGGASGAELVAHKTAFDGDLAAAIGLLDGERRADDAYDPFGGRQWGTTLQRAVLAWEADDLAGVEARLEDAKARGLSSGIVEVHSVEVLLAGAAGDRERARAPLADLLAAVDREGYIAPRLASDVIAALLAAGCGVSELTPVSRRVGYYVGDELAADDPGRRLIDAQLAEAAGDEAAAAALYTRAAATLGDAGDMSAGHAGTAHVRAARCLIALGRLDEARGHAEAAAERLARWGGWRTRELDAVQRRLGLAATPSGPSALTPREREVAGLLAEGLTNAGLADKLFISPRTAAVHVSNLLSKLGMSSRTEVAAWVAAGGLGPSNGDHRPSE